MDFFVRLEKHIDAVDGKEAIEKAAALGADCIIGIATCPYDLIEQAEHEEARGMSLQDHGDNDLVDELRSRGYMIHLTTGPKTAHIQIEENAK